MVIGGLISHGIGLMAQNGMTPPGKYLPKAQIMKEIDNFKIPPGGPIGGESFTILPAYHDQLVVRRRIAGPNNASIHATESNGGDGQNYTEVMEVIDGSGTVMTGGNFVDKNPIYAKKDRTKGITGGVTQEVKAGDFFIIPPGTAHWFSKINGQVTIVETRFPGDVTKEK